jgi:hypothetical protein
LTVTLPSEQFISPKIALRTDDLPDPNSPIKATNYPFLIFILMF